MIHGIVSKELYGLCREYEAERHANHIITLSDMLVRSAALVKDYPEVRRKLHDRYKVFFVDEYQDTNPVQTELILAIAADQYDPDWHLSVPGAGGCSWWATPSRVSTASPGRISPSGRRLKR